MKTGTKEGVRKWCAVIQYPNLKPVMFGTLLADWKDPIHKVEEEMIKVILKHLPQGFKLIELIPGQIWFQEE